MKYLSIIFILFFSTTIFGQSQKMTLKECLDFALDNSHKTKQSKLDIENNEYVMREKKAAIYPKVDAKVALTRNFNLPTRILTADFPGLGQQVVPITLGVENYMDYGVKLKQPLFNASLFTALKLAEPSREIFQQLLSRSEDEIIYDIAQQYYGILKSEEQKNVVDVNLERLDKLLELVNLQVENDFGKPTDVKNIELKIADVKVLETQLNTGIEIQYKALKLLMGMDLQKDISVTDFKPNAALPADMNAPTPEEVSNLQILTTQKLLAQLGRELIKKEAYPTLDFFIFYGGQFQDDNFEFGNNDNWNSVAFAGVDLKIPIYDGKSRKSKIQQSNVALKKLDNDYEQAAAFSQFEFEKTAAELRSQLAILDAQNQKIELLKDLYNQTLLQFRENSSSIIELLNAEADLRQSELTYSTQLFDYQLIILNYFKTKGMLKSLN